VDLFHAYACLMGGVELAYELRANADYMLFSEALFPAEEWSYEALETIVNSVDGVSALDIGKAFCDSAYDYFSAPDMNRAFTLSLIYLARIDNLASVLENFANSAVSDINGNGTQSSYYYAALLSCIGVPLWDYYNDLGAYLTGVTNSPVISSSVKDYAQNVQSEVSNSVAYMKNYIYPATGISIFHNILYGLSTYPVATYNTILTFGSNSWASYIALMDSFGAPPLVEDEYEPDDTSASAKEITINGAAQIHTLDDPSDDDWLYFDGVSDTNYIIACNGLFDILDMYLYSADDLNNAIDWGFIGFPIEFNCPQDGRYYIEIDSFANQDGVYLISVQEGTLHRKPLLRRNTRSSITH